MIILVLYWRVFSEIVHLKDNERIVVFEKKFSFKDTSEFLEPWVSGWNGNATVFQTLEMNELETLTSKPPWKMKLIDDVIYQFCSRH